MKEIAKISIVVPVYRVEQYLKQCVDSILTQTYQNLEIILVDDGSPDRCPELCDEYTQKDERIRVIHQNNRGLSDARNAGLEICTGDYIGFVDSDDWISQSMYEELVGSAIKYNAEIAYCGVIHIDDQKGICLEKRDYGAERAISAEKFLYNILSREHENVSIWNKLYSSAVFSEIRFPSGRIYEDAAILCQIVERISTIACSGTIGYYYRARGGSIMNSGIAERHWEALKPILLDIRAYVQKKYPHFLHAYYCYDVSTIAYIVTLYDKQSDSSSIECRQLRRRLWKYLPYYVMNRNGRFKNKIANTMIAAGLFLPAQKLLHTVRRKYGKKN